MGMSKQPCSTQLSKINHMFRSNPICNAPMIELQWWSLGYFRYVEIIQEIHYPCCYRIKLTSFYRKYNLLSSDYLSLVALTCNFVISRMKENDTHIGLHRLTEWLWLNLKKGKKNGSRSSVAYSRIKVTCIRAHYLKTFRRRSYSETREWVEILLRNQPNQQHLSTSAKPSPQNVSFKKTPCSTASQGNRCINQPGSLECHVGRKQRNNFLVVFLVPFFSFKF